MLGDHTLGRRLFAGLAFCLGHYVADSGKVLKRCYFWHACVVASLYSTVMIVQCAPTDAVVFNGC